MALPKLYDRVYWDNNTTPAINEDNLNSLSKAVDDIDDRVISLAGTIMEDVPQIQEDLEILEPAIENIDSNVERAETAADDAEDSAETAEYWANVSNPPIPVVKDFASVITVDDAIPKAATDVKVKVNAVQDLHGYDKPWVGGAGKNKLPMTVSAIKAANTIGTWSGNTYTRDNGSFKVNTDNDGNVTDIVLTSTNSSDNSIMYIPFTLKSGSYILSNTYSETFGSLDTYLVNSQNTVIARGNSQSPGNSFTLSADENVTLNIRNNINSSTNKVFKPMLRLSTVSDSTFEQYENKCSISGFTEVDLPRTGKNLLPLRNAVPRTLNGVTFSINNDGSVTANGTATATTDFYVYSEGSPNYSATDLGSIKDGCILTGCPSGGSDSKYQLIAASNTGRYATDSGSGATMVIPSSENTIRVLIRVYSGYTCNNLVFKPMIRLAADTDATYAPYDGTDYIINLGGTRYGATLDVTSGVMTVLYGIKGASDFESFSDGTSAGGLRYAQTDAAGSKSNGNGICNMAAVDNTNAWASTIPVAQVSSTAGRLRFYCNSANRTAFLSEYADLQFVYELATPITVQLTPTEVQMLQGYNVLSANSGDVYLEYDASMIQRIANEKLDIDTFQSVVASSSDFADFKTKVAAL